MAKAESTWGSVQSVDHEALPSLFQVRENSPQDAECLLWTPNSEKLDVLSELPGIAFQCETDATGKRRLLPFGTASNSGRLMYFYAAWHYGFQILCHQLPEKFDEHVRFSYHMMWFLFLRARKMQQFIRRRFHHKKDLELVGKKEHSGNGNKSILPWAGDESARNRGYPQSLNDFLDQGKEEAKRHGVKSPTVANKIEFSFLLASKLEPRTPLEGDETARLVKNTLFDLDYSVDPLPKERAEQVEELILNQIWPHIIGQETPKEFDNWFAGNRSVFVKEVARQLNDMEEREATQIVTAALVEYGWYAYQYIADCIQATMHDVARSLPEPLTTEEAESFDLLYYPQSHFGGLPLILLGDRLESVRLLARELLESPKNKDLIGELHCLLQFYVAIVQSRRNADRDSKRPHQPSVFIKYEDKDKGSYEIEPVFFREETLDVVLYRELRQMFLQNLTNLIEPQCPCENPDWQPKLHEPSKVTAHISLVCSRCGTESETTSLSLSKAKKWLSDKSQVS